MKIRRLMSQTVILPFFLIGIYFFQMNDPISGTIMFLIVALHTFHLYELKKGRL